MALLYKAYPDGCQHKSTNPAEAKSLPYEGAWWGSCLGLVFCKPDGLKSKFSCGQSKQSLDDAIEYQSARMEVLSLLLAHSADSDEIYMPGWLQKQ